MINTLLSNWPFSLLPNVRARAVHRGGQPVHEYRGPGPGGPAPSLSKKKMNRIVLYLNLVTYVIRISLDLELWAPFGQIKLFFGTSSLLGCLDFNGGLFY